MGDNCKYDGGNNKSEKLLKFVDGHEVFKVCPESLGGLPTPRDPSEMVDGVIKSNKGVTVDEEFRQGAQKTLKIALDNNVDMAILQSRSPSCGVHQIYDGTFSGTLITGMGVCAKLLSENGIKVIDIEDL